MKDNTAQVVAQVPVDVATFLLNEKRNDVLSIESRFKVSLLLVPNRHLETPNFKLERLRHDDLNHAEPLPMSFDMVEAPEQPDPAKEKKEEAKEVRQEAVVKGITPAQPAPVAAAEPMRAPAPAAHAAVPGHAGTWFDKMMGWFRHKPAQAPAPAPEPSAPARDDRQRRDGRGRGPHQDRRDGRDRRDDRRGEGGQQGRDRRDERRGDRRDNERREGQRPQQQGQRQGQGQRNEQRRNEGRRDEAARGESARGESAEREQAQRREGSPRPERERREGPKPERAQGGERRPPSPDKVAAPVGALVEGGSLSAEGTDERREGGRRRRRRGRGGGNGAGERHDHHAQETPASIAAPIESHDALSSAAVPAKFALPEAFEPDRHAPIPADVPAAASEPVGETTHVPVVPAPAPSRPPFVEPRHEPKVADRPAAPVETPVPYALPADSGLEMIETRHARDAQAPVEDLEPPRPKRVRPPRATLQDEPLEFVETRKDAPPAP